MTTLTTRGRAEKLAADLDRDVAALRANPTDDALRDRVKSSTNELAAVRAEHESARVKAWSGPTSGDPLLDGGGEALSDASRRHLDQALAGRPPLDGVAKRNAASLSFDRSALKSLHTAVTNRATATKAALTVTEVPQAGIPDSEPAPWPGLREMTRVLDFMAIDTTDATTVQGFKAGALADAAATVAPGADKPESSPDWVSFTSPVRKLAHWVSVEDEVIADFSGFFNVLGTEMIAGLITEENAQLLNGDGVGTNLLGLIPAATAASATVGSAGTDLDAVLAAITKIRTSAFVNPDLIMMHPNDWGSAGFAAAKDTAGRYLIADAVTSTTLSLWGLRVVLTTAVPENTALVANMARAARVWVRESPRLEVAPIASGANFINNTTQVRCEERLALEVVRPEALCVVGDV